MFEKIIDQSIHTPFQAVDCASDDFLQVNSKFSIVKKYLSRYVRLLVGGQIGLEVATIPVDGRILWLHTGKRNIGDALIEASGRLLLKSRGVRIDLLTLSNLAPVFDGDDIYINKFYDISHIDSSKYDYILMTEFNHRTIRVKVKYFKKLPYACLFRYFYGPDRNQTMFSFAAVNEVFGLGFGEDLSGIAKPYMHVDQFTKNQFLKIKPEAPFLVISVGGIDANRTYKQWGSVLHLLNESELANTVSNVVLLGSENGVEDAAMLMKLRLSRIKVRSYVAKLSLKESQVMISHALRFLGCDGGLMHVAHTTSTPTVVIFASEPNHLRLTPRCFATPLQGLHDVNDIAPVQILNALQDSFNIQAERN
jgi:ADP-heptose:LPS heptosyltransferase